MDVAGFDLFLFCEAGAPLQGAHRGAGSAVHHAGAGACNERSNPGGGGRASGFLRIGGSKRKLRDHGQGGGGLADGHRAVEVHFKNFCQESECRGEGPQHDFLFFMWVFIFDFEKSTPAGLEKI
jgi:hypothetical protein